VIVVKKIMVIILAALFALTLISTSFAEWQLSEVPKAYEFLQITGEVKAVDRNAMAITVTKKIKDEVMAAVTTVDDETKITMDEQNKNFNDIKVGDTVIVKYTQVNGKNIAKSVVIEPPVTETEKKAE
jgi:Cu/Ag efflux protein CusF